MPYTPNATDTTEPVASREVVSAAQEFRTLKSSVNSRIASVTAALALESSIREAVDNTLAGEIQTNSTKITALEQLAFNGATPGTVVKESFAAAGTAYTLSVTPVTVATVDVYINGVYQNQSTFTVVGNVVTLSEAPVAGAVVEIQASIPLSIGITDAGSVEYLPAGTGAVPATVQTKLRECVSVKDFGAVGDGVADDTAAIQAAITYANSLAYAGIAANLLVPGATVHFPDGKYLLSSLSSTINIRCNITKGAAAIIIPNAYAGTALSVGLDTDLNTLITASIDFPDVYKAWGAAIVAGSVGIRLMNVNKSTIRFGRVSLFETLVWFGGKGEGFVYNEVHLGNFNYGKTLVKLIPEMGTAVAGWCNDNKFFGGNLQQFVSGGANQIQVDINGTVSTVAGNNFYGTSLEGDGPEWIVRCVDATTNTFYGAHHETGSAGIDVTVSGDTLTKTAHGLSVNDLVSIYATTLPGGLYDSTPYWVVAVPTADTFKVSLNYGGTAITASTTGTAVKYIKQLKCLFNNTGKPTVNNTFHNLFTPTSVFIGMIEQGGVGTRGNGIEERNNKTAVEFVSSDTPLYRGSNTTTVGTSNRPIFAAYENNKNPNNEPTAWSTAISPRGLLFNNSSTGAVVGRMYASTSNGYPYFQTLGSSIYQLPLVILSGLLSVSALSVPANGRAFSTQTVTGAAVGDIVTVTPFNAWPDGIALAWARVSAANTVQIAFHNWTAASISLSTDFKIMVTKT